MILDRSLVSYFVWIKVLPAGITESEYIAVYDATKKVVWLKKFITGLDVIPSIENSVDLYCDNNGAIVIREIVERGDVKICRVDTNENVVDPLTKALQEPKQERHVSSLGIRFMHDWN